MFSTKKAQIQVQMIRTFVLEISAVVLVLDMTSYKLTNGAGIKFLFSSECDQLLGVLLISK